MKIKVKVRQGISSIHIRKGPSTIIIALTVFILFERFFIQLGAPEQISYLTDLLIIYLAVKVVSNKSWKKFNLLVIGYMFCLAYTILFSIINFRTWGFNFISLVTQFERWLKYLVFFLSCCSLLGYEDVRKIFNLLTGYFYINSIYIIILFFTYHPRNTVTRGDLLNGFFGVYTGGNSCVNVLMLVVICHQFCEWINKRISMKKMLFPLFLSVLIAGLIELKVYFLEIIIIYIWYWIRQKKTVKDYLRNVAIIVGVLVVVMISLNQMYKEYPWFRDVLTIKGVINLISDEKGYVGTGDLNRMNGISIITKEIFNNDIFSSIFGIGLGTASLGGSFSTESVFSNQYGSMHYGWFLSTWIFIQAGILGLTAYIISFIYFIKKKKNLSEYSLLVEMAAILSIILIFYDISMISDAGLFMYFALSSGFCSYERNGQRNITVS